MNEDESNSNVVKIDMWSALQNVTQLVVELNAKVDVLLKNSKVPTPVDQQPEDQQQVLPDCSEEMEIDQIKTLDDAYRLDHKLHYNPDYKKKLKEKLIREYGTNIGNGAGNKSVSHDLGEKMFNRSFFQKCSYTGKTPTGKQHKSL